MARDHYVAVPLRLGGREDGVEHGDRAPVAEEVALLVPRPRVLAKVERVARALREGEVRVGLRGRRGGAGERVAALEIGEGALRAARGGVAAHGAEEAAGLGGGHACAAEVLPDVPVVLPVGAKVAADHALDAGCGARCEGTNAVRGAVAYPKSPVSRCWGTFYAPTARGCGPPPWC